MDNLLHDNVDPPCENCGDAIDEWGLFVCKYCFNSVVTAQIMWDLMQVPKYKSPEEFVLEYNKVLPKINERLAEINLPRQKELKVPENYLALTPEQTYKAIQDMI